MHVIGAVLFAVTDEVDGRHCFESVKLVFHDFVQLLATAGVHGPSGHAQETPFEFAGGGELATGEGVFHAVAVVGEVDAHVIPGLVGHFVALVIQGLGVAVGDLHHTAGLQQGFLTHRRLVQQLLVLVFAVLDVLHGPVEFRGAVRLSDLAQFLGKDYATINGRAAGGDTFPERNKGTGHGR